MIYLNTKSTRQNVLNLLIITALMLSACAKSAAASGGPGQIVFNIDLGVHGHRLYIEQADGSNVRQLIKSDFDDANASLSPDGKTVIFTRNYPTGGNSGIFVINVDGTGLHEIIDSSCAKPCNYQGVEGHPWSPDGKQIVFFRAVYDTSGNLTEVGWWVMNSDGSGAHLLRKLTDSAEDHYPAWSPDGKRFVFMRRDNTKTPIYSAIFTMSINGTDPRQLTPWNLDASEPDWSPDGTKILFCNNECDDPTNMFDQNIYTIHPDGTGLVKLTTYPAPLGHAETMTSHPAWSPDGSQIVFAHGISESGHYDQYVMNPDGSNLHVITHKDPIDVFNPDWGSGIAQ